jgi:hypothetical protein
MVHRMRFQEAAVAAVGSLGSARHGQPLVNSLGHEEGYGLLTKARTSPVCLAIEAVPPRLHESMNACSKHARSCNQRNCECGCSKPAARPQAWNDRAREGWRDLSGDKSRQP